MRYEVCGKLFEERIVREQLSTFYLLLSTFYFLPSTFYFLLDYRANSSTAKPMPMRKVISRMPRPVRSNLSFSR